MGSRKGQAAKQACGKVRRGCKQGFGLELLTLTAWWEQRAAEQAGTDRIV